MGLLDAIVFSLLPVSELRGGIPIALSQGINPITAYLVCVFANMLVFPVVFLFLNTLHKGLMKINFYNKTFNRFLEKVHKKTHKKIEKYGYIGLTLFVMVPLPVTGAYTGTVAAWFFGMKKSKAFFAIAMGIVAAGVIVTSAYLTGAEVLSWVL